MWAEQIIMGVIGLSSGVAVAGGLFSFIVELGVVADLADRTHTAEHLLLYEDSVALGGILGNILFCFPLFLHCPAAVILIPGLMFGIFVGCWAMAFGGNFKCVPDFYQTSEIGTVYQMVYYRNCLWKRCWCMDCILSIKSSQNSWKLTKN